MNVLVIGGGGREHAIIKKLKENDTITKLYVAPGNGGISKDAICLPVGACDIDGMVTLCKEKSIDFAVVAPDDPLVAGMVDSLEGIGVKCFGPNKAAAALEGSKVFSKNLMKKYCIPTAGYEVFSNPTEAIAFLAQSDFPTVIKADGLALGKGVIIAEDLAAATNAVRAIMEDKQFGASGNQIVIEEFLTGPEVSVLSFCDGKTIVPMISAMDHKRALDGDRGLNTGGMGTIAPNPCYNAEMATLCMDTIYRPTMEAMNAEGRPFKGIIFFGMMLTPKGPKVIEYNCRFGDPETQVVLPLLETDLFSIFQAVQEERLSELDICFAADKAAACIVVASGGYPESYPKGLPIAGLNAEGGSDAAVIYHAGTTFENGQFLTNGGRVLGITQVGETLPRALENAYQAVKTISFDGMQYRLDIGKRALFESV